MWAMSKTFYVYIMTSRSGTLYIGVTSDLARRVYEHKHGLIPGFTSKYRGSRLVYCKHTDHVGAAIDREKQLNGRGKRRSPKFRASTRIGRTSAWSGQKIAPGGARSLTLRSG
jgi:putative endonuclease